MLAKRMFCVLLCVIFLHFIDGIIVQNQQCNDSLLQNYARTNDTFTQQFVNTQSNYLFRFDSNAVLTFPYENSGIYIVFNATNEHQVIITFPESGVLLTGIQFSKVTGRDNKGCEASTTITDTIDVSYRFNEDWRVVLFDSVGGEGETFSLYTRRSIKPIFAHTIIFQFPTQSNATICAQFELFGCIVSSSTESLDIPGVVETIYPVPDNSPADYTGECGSEYCSGGTGILTDVVTDGACNVWTRNAGSILQIWFTLSSPMEIKLIAVHLVADNFDKEYTVGVMTESQTTVKRTVIIPASSTTFQLVIEEFFSIKTVNTSFISLGIASTEAGQFRICEVEIQNVAGVIDSFSICKIDEVRNIICTEDPTPRNTDTLAMRTLPDIRAVITVPGTTVTLNNGRNQDITTPTTTTFQTTQPNPPLTTTTELTSTPPLPLNVEFYAILGIGLFATLLLLSFIIATVVVVLSIYVRNRKKTARKSHEFPWANCEIYSVENVPERESHLFEKVVVKDKVFYVRTPEGMKQFPNLPANPVYELVEGGFDEFRIQAGSSCNTTPTSTLSSPIFPGGMAVVDGNVIPLYEELT